MAIASTIPDAANMLAQGDAQIDWAYYALLFALMLVASAAGNFLAAYFKKRGESYATKADFDQILGQLRHATEISESIKLEISHDDWINRQSRSIRREKLEELLEAVYATRHWLDGVEGHYLFGEEESKIPNPVYRVSIVGRLYFPELTKELGTFELSVGDYRSALLESKATIFPLRQVGNFDAVKTATRKATGEVMAKFRPLQEATHKIEVKAIEIMESLLWKR